jgi:hypothetical protein
MSGLIIDNQDSRIVGRLHRYYSLFLPVIAWK